MKLIVQVKRKINNQRSSQRDRNELQNNQFYRKKIAKVVEAISFGLELL